MHKTSFFLALIMVMDFALSPQRVRASEEDEVHGLEFAGAVNLVQKNVKVDGTILLPQKATRVRSVIVIINWGLGQAVYEDPRWLKLSETLESGAASREDQQHPPRDFEYSSGGCARCGVRRGGWPDDAASAPRRGFGA